MGGCVDKRIDIKAIIKIACSKKMFVPATPKRSF
jgi:hypothetical protein